MPYALSALLGLVLGALLNVLADDLPARRAPRLPVCGNCGRTHPPHYWLAVGAYLFGGRCVHCGAPIRLRHVLTELTSALIVVYLWNRFGATTQFVFTAAIVAGLLLITVIDVEHRLILRVVVYPAMIIALIAGLLDPSKGAVKTLVGGAVGFGLTYLLYLLGGLFSLAVAKMRGRELHEIAFGGGDVNLAGFIGLAVGWSGILFALFIAVIAGGLGGAIYLLVMILRRKASLFMAIPYGPFLALGGLVMLLWGKELATWYLGR
ncbi:MAG: prepilin peptidase [Chloroflexi bacterium]|nr:prepilin peptidase [Chloroflexota bacterium]